MSELAAEFGALQPLVPPLALAVCIACVAGAGALANCALLAGLFKRSRNGLVSILIQLSIADLILLGTSIAPELWAFNTRTWYFGRSACIAYRGLNVVSTTASLYLVATIALHALATVGLEEKITQSSMKRDDRNDDDEIRSSRHSLVTSDTSTPPRTMNVDYRLTDTRIRIAPPVAFVWVLSASLSIPEFVLATTVHFDHDVVLCTLVDTTHRLSMHSLLAVFNLFLPFMIMSTAAILIIIKLKSNKRRSESREGETHSALKLSLFLISMYIILCTPRSIVMVYSLYSTSTADNEYAVEQPNYTLALANLACSCIYLAAIVVRPLLCITLLPCLRKTFFDRRNSNMIDI
ncbi:unnamed protein product [Parnassius apollo]|uniref:(apollo) hypothetical protein n=1 Tax=Parnassius apollo TaxID=110799 RepID=A0A8S3WTC3_PARAO|nr:unnamed protein product [Parnassius apollo]